MDKALQAPYPQGFNDNIYHQGYISKLPDFDVDVLLDIRKRENAHMINVNMTMLNVKTVL